PEIRRIEIQGHTDNVGGKDYNQELSQQRANAVKEYLVKLGVEAGRLDTKGYGETKPIAPNINEQGKAKNRRVQFMILEQVKKEVRSRRAAATLRAPRGTNPPRRSSFRRPTRASSAATGAGASGARRARRPRGAGCAGDRRRGGRRGSSTPRRRGGRRG